MSDSDIFKKIRLRPTQLRTVADRRMGDAEALRLTKKNAHANGAIYLGGFVIECLLKAKLLEEFPWLQSAGSPDGRQQDKRRLWHLCYQSHDLDIILGKLPKIVLKLRQLEQRESNRLTASLKSICARWTIQARYSPSQADINDARTFLDQIGELKQWLV